MLITLNIGLNVGTIEPTTQKAKTVSAVENNFFNDNLFYIRFQSSQYGDIKENTLIASVKLEDDNTYDLTESLKLLCDHLQQECIAYYNHSHGFGELIYSDSYRGEKMEFDIQYFKF